MKIILLIVLALATSNLITAQTKSDGSNPHKIVFQLTSEDTLVHKSLMKQLNNVITVSPSTKIEVVCHGPGLSILILNKTIVQANIQGLKEKNIEFIACEFSMSEKKITKDQMIPEAGYVKYGILEIVTKQEEGWSYIKLGF